MTDVMLEKIDHIEKMLVEINTKIDNFLGFEELTDEEKKELSKAQAEIEQGDFVKFDDLF